MGSSLTSANGFHLAGEKIHQQVLAQIFRRDEVRLGFAHGRDPLHKLHQPGVAFVDGGSSFMVH